MHPRAPPRPPNSAPCQLEIMPVPYQQLGGDPQAMATELRDIRGLGVGEGLTPAPAPSSDTATGCGRLSSSFVPSGLLVTRYGRNISSRSRDISSSRPKSPQARNPFASRRSNRSGEGNSLIHYSLFSMHIGSRNVHRLQELGALMRSLGQFQG